VLFGNKSQPLLGLDITTSSVKLIELSQSGKRYRVESYSGRVLFGRANPPELGERKGHR